MTLKTESWKNLSASLENEQRRRKAARSFLDYVEYLDIGVTPAAHHRLLIRELEALERGEVNRLMVLMPPGSAKSTYSTILFPPWFLGRNPATAALCVSNTTALAERFSRRARNIVASPPHRTVFGEGVSDESSAAGSWETTNGSEYFAAGVGASITGRRADLGLIDDPVKSREEADSENTREKHWDWYVNDYETRLKPNARRLHIQTRWHEDDLAGRILEREAHKWRVIKLPMEAVRGDPLGRQVGERLWAEWFTDDMVETAKRDRRVWSALYQQEPAPDDGTFFRREWFTLVDPRTVRGYAYTTGDFAVTEGDGDFTEIGTHVYANGVLTLAVDGWYGQTSADVWISKLLDQTQKHNAFAFFGETGPIRRAVEPFLKRQMLDRNAWVRLEWLTRSADKPAMARPLQAMAASGKVQIADTEYGHRLLNQLLQFPAGKYDDAVDMAGLMGMAIADAHPAVLSANEPERKSEPRDYEIAEQEDTWRVA